ncbi:MAG: hypothetical protein WC829_18830 [Hyphomicrobium sp.]
MIVEGGQLGGERHPDKLPGAKSQLRCWWAAQDHLDDTLADAANAFDTPILAPHAPGPHDINQERCSCRVRSENKPDEN